MKTPLLIPDVGALRRKMENPSELLCPLRDRFYKRLETEPEYRKANLFLPALLGDPKALQEAREIILHYSQELGAMPPEDPAREIRPIYCWGPGAMRMAIYFDWLECHGIWNPQESRDVALHLLRFCDEQMVSTLRSRPPSSNNQSLAMGLTCMIVGHVFRDQSGLEERASSLSYYGRRVVEDCLRYLPRDGYCGEGSTYQSHCLSPMMMFVAAFLCGTEGQDILCHSWEPHGGSLLEILNFESCLGSPGRLLPPWDHYGWQPQATLAPQIFASRWTEYADDLRMASDIWNRKTSAAWADDDRMWSLIFWPTPEPCKVTEGRLRGWSRAHTGATIDDHVRKSRLMLAWDACSDSIHGHTRYQVNPNHLLYEQGGVPLFGDGMPREWHGPCYMGVDENQILSPLNPLQREQMDFTYGDAQKWARGAQVGLIGSANTIFLDGEAGYLPGRAVHGCLVFEERSPDRHTVTAECRDYYQPRYDVLRARRTLSSSPEGVAWILDDYETASPHRFTWQVHLRRGAQSTGPGSVSFTTPEGISCTLAWCPVVEVQLETVPEFPARGDGVSMLWPDEGSERLRLHLQGMRGDFVVCVIPDYSGPALVRSDGPEGWVCEWGCHTEKMNVPVGAKAPFEMPQDPPLSRCDLDEPAFGLSGESDEVLADYLKNPPPLEWRRTTQAMQTLTMRKVASALPLIHLLLNDSTQTYHVRSVAGWCLGHASYRPAWDDLVKAAQAPEQNLSWRAGWAVERMKR